jgi:hypothetical protein
MNRRFLSLTILAVFLAVPALAAHRWSTYHWSKGAGEITPPVTMNLSGSWPNYASRVMSDWNASTVIASPWSYGAISNVKRCTSATGKIEVCNARYGQNGWLGIAGISLSGGHIVKGYTKLNDTYFDTANYNTPAWRRMVFCQEVGHDYGLGHVNENFNDPNTGSCMDYTNDPSRNDGAGTNEYPNNHDYNELLTIYNHSHSSSMIFDMETNDATRPRTMEEIMSKADQWGTPIAFDSEGRPSIFYRPVAPNHGGAHDEPITEGELTHVFWAPVDPFDRPEDGRDGINKSK